VWKQLIDTGSHLLREVVVVQTECMFLEAIDYLLRGASQDIMYLMNLIYFIIAWEEGVQTDDFKHDTPNTPKIHFIILISVC